MNLVHFLFIYVYIKYPSVVILGGKNPSIDLINLFLDKQINILADQQKTLGSITRHNKCFCPPVASSWQTQV